MTNLRYVLYARKSTESTERQVQSIDDQIKVLKALAQSYKLHITHELVEAKSAKAPDKRPVFDHAMQLIESGKADAFLTWKYDRLSRNPVDSGRLSYLLQNNVIKEIRTMERTYHPDDNVLLLSVEGGMANQYIRDLSKNVKRGMDSKAGKGWRPGIAPVGYMNDAAHRIIVQDEERAWIVRKMFDLLFSGYSIQYITDYVDKELGLRTIRRHKSGGIPLHKSAVYTMFKNPFYCGYFKWNGELMRGAHEPIISFEEHRRAVALTSNQRAQRPKGELAFLYRGKITCGDCRCTVTPELKVKQTKRGKKYHTYYRCTHKKRDYPCKQMPLKLERVEEQIIAELARYQIIPEFYDWALEVLGKRHQQESQELHKVHTARSNAVTRAEDELQELMRMRIRKLVDDDEYKSLKQALIIDLERLKVARAAADDSNTNWLAEMEQKLDTARTAMLTFMHGSDEQKLNLLAMFGQGFTLKDRTLTLTPEPWLIPIRDNYKKLEAAYLGLEPKNLENNRGKMAEIASIRQKWSG